MTIIGRPTILLLLIAATAAFADDQTVLKVAIIPDPDSTVGSFDETQIIANVVAIGGTNVPTGTIVQSTDQTIFVDLCTEGTFSTPDGAACANCPAGTANPVKGAPNAMACLPCSAGGWSADGASVCTKCVANTFSTTYRAESAGRCVACPPHSTSPPGSPQIEGCTCDGGFFQSSNLLPAFDGVVVSLGFERVAAVDLPHVVC
jgi:hypothetical protein